MEYPLFDIGERNYSFNTYEQYSTEYSNTPEGCYFKITPIYKNTSAYKYFFTIKMTYCLMVSSSIEKVKYFMSSEFPITINTPSDTLFVDKYGQIEISYMTSVLQIAVSETLKEFGKRIPFLQTSPYPNVTDTHAIALQLLEATYLSK